MAAPPDPPDGASAPPIRQRRSWRLLVWGALALALFAVLGFLAVPWLARSQLEKLLSAELDRPVRVERIEFNPFSLRAVASGVTVSGRAAGDPALLAFGSLELDAAWNSIFRRAPVLEALRLREPVVHLSRQPDGRLDIGDLLDKWSAPRPDPQAGPARFAIANLELTGGRLVFDDRLAGSRHEIELAELRLPFVSSLPGDEAVEVEPSISARIDGSDVRLQGRTLPFSPDLRSVLDLKVEALDLARYRGYAPRPLPVEIASAVLSTDLQVAFSRKPDETPALEVTGGAELARVEVRAPAAAPLLVLEKLKATGLRLLPLTGEFEVAAVSLERPELTLHRKRTETRFLEPVLAALEASGAAGSAASRPTAAARASGPEATPPASSEGSGAASKGGPVRWRIGELAVIAGSVDFADQRFSPSPLALRANELTVRISGLSNALDTALPFEIGTVLATGERVEASGEFVPQPLKLAGKAAVRDVALKNWWWIVAPRVQADLTAGRFAVSSAFRVADAGPRPSVLLDGLAAELSGLTLQQRWDRKETVQVGSLKAEGVDLDLSGQRLGIANFAAAGGRLALERDREGLLNLERMFTDPKGAADRGAGVPPAASVTTPATPGGPGGRSTAGVPGQGASGPAAGATPPWSFSVRRASVDGWDFSLSDAVAGPAADLRVRGIRLRAEGLSSAARERASVSLNASVGRSGALEASGRIGLNPLGGKLAVDARSLRILPAQPYFARYVNAIVSSGALSAKGVVDFDLPAGRPPRVAYTGQLTFADFAAVTPQANEDLLNWKSLHLGGIDFALDPMKIEIGEIALTDFFARLVLSEQGRLNVPELLVHETSAETPDPASSQAPSDGQSPSSPGGASTADKSARGADAPPQPAGPAPTAATEAPLPLRIGRITVANGAVEFSDRFVRPNYTANLSALNGSVSTLAPDTAGDVDLRGRIDGTGTLELTGRLNPLAPTAFVQLQAKARDIDLPRTSPYAVQYLGYGIEKGKLSANLKYTLENRRLEAENNIILDQLTFGERVESPTATKLPVLFAVSLLKDRNGIIDVNLPIGGSLDDPEFSVGGIVLRIIFNLIAKAVTAPFSLIAGLVGGGGGELSSIPYAAGSAGLDEEARKRLEALARALRDRPAVKAELAGRVDPEADRAALRKLAVDRLLKAQKLRDRVGRGRTAGAIDEVTIDPAEYPELLKAAYRAASFPKPRNAIGLVKDLPLPEMEQLLLVNTTVPDNALADLARSRADAAKTWLTGEGGIEGERLFVTAPKLSLEGLAPGRAPTSVDVSLR